MSVRFTVSGNSIADQLNRLRPEGADVSLTGQISGRALAGQFRDAVADEADEAGLGTPQIHTLALARNGGQTAAIDTLRAARDQMSSLANRKAGEVSIRMSQTGDRTTATPGTRGMSLAEHGEEVAIMVRNTVQSQPLGPNASAAHQNAMADAAAQAANVSATGFSATAGTQVQETVERNADLERAPRGRILAGLKPQGLAQAQPQAEPQVKAMEIPMAGAEQDSLQVSSGSSLVQELLARYADSSANPAPAAKGNIVERQAIAAISANQQEAPKPGYHSHKLPEALRLDAAQQGPDVSASKKTPLELVKNSPRLDFSATQEQSEAPTATKLAQQGPETKPEAQRESPGDAYRRLRQRTSTPFDIA